jgi:hypothetical protein
MNYRLLISTPWHDWEEHFDSLPVAESRLEQLQGISEREGVYCNLTLLQTIADITINRKGVMG